MRSSAGIVTSQRGGSWVVLALAATLCACGCKEAWELSDRPTAPPDEQYTVPGVGLGGEVYVWHCYQGRRVAIRKSHDEWVCSSARIERGPCGTPLALENDRGRGRGPVSKPWR